MKKALIVEYNEGIRRLLIEILTQEGYLVETTSEGSQALSRIQEYAPAVVLLDSQTLIRQGIEILTKISDSYPNLPVILIAYTDETYVDALLKSGLVRHLITKPFSITDLLELLHSLVK